MNGRCAFLLLSSGLVAPPGDRRPDERPPGRARLGLAVACAFLLTGFGISLRTQGLFAAMNSPALNNAMQQMASNANQAMVGTTGSSAVQSAAPAAWITFVVLAVSALAALVGGLVGQRKADRQVYIAMELVQGRQQMGLAPPGEAAPKAKAAATKAVALDGGLAEAHFVRACIRTFTDWDFAGADEDWRRALELNPNLAEARTFHSHYLAIVKRSAESELEIEQALGLDPFNPLTQAMHGMLRFFSGRCEEALAIFQQMPEGFRDAGMWYTHSSLGHDTEAAGALRAFLQSVGDRALEEAFQRGFDEGGYRLAAKRAAAAVAASTTAACVPTDLAIMLAEAGEDAQVLDCLERAIEERDPNMPYLGLWPQFRRLHGEERFQALYRRVGLPD